MLIKNKTFNLLTHNLLLRVLLFWMFKIDILHVISRHVIHKAVTMNVEDQQLSAVVRDKDPKFQFDSR